MRPRETLAAALLLAHALVAAAAPPPPAPQNAPSDAFAAAAAALEAGHASEALSRIEVIVAGRPWIVSAHMLRQDALAALGRGDESAQWYAAEAARDPQDTVKALLAARVSPREGGARESAYRDVFARDPALVWARIALSYELTRRARDEAARATTLSDGGFPDAARAAQESAAKARSEAREFAASAVSMRPDLAAAQAALADTLLGARESVRGQRAADALRAAEEAARLDPGSATAWERAGRARRAVSDDQGAVTAFERAAALAPRNAVVFANLGRVLLDLRRDAAARDALETAARLAPQDPVVAMNRGVAQFRLGDLEAAARAFERAARDAPADPRPFEGQALTLARLGRREEAAAAMERYLANGGADRDAARQFIERMRASPGAD